MAEAICPCEGFPRVDSAVILAVGERGPPVGGVPCHESYSVLYESRRVNCSLVGAQNSLGFPTIAYW